MKNGKPDKTEYTDSNGDKAPIPGGFYVVDDSKENPEDKNTVRDGLVISDIEGDDLDNSKHGNQFVWIPVTDYSKFHLIAGYYNGDLQTMQSEESDPSREAGDTTTAGSPGLPDKVNSTAGSAESIAMYKSVKENKGFYIARFEAGMAVGTITSTTMNDEKKQIQDGTIKPVSQKGVEVWNSLTWGGTTVVEASDNLPGNDNSDGAVKVARSMYQEDGKPDGVHKVTSTLCYGVQWDAALKFIEPNYGEYNEEKTDYKVAVDSYVKTAIKNKVARGNYIGSIATTGSNTAYQQKHIYDMAGNVDEWTMEARSDGCRVIRGGDYSSDGSAGPASVRGYYGPGYLDIRIGARVTLYL